MILKSRSKTYTNPAPNYSITPTINSNNQKEVIISIDKDAIESSDTLWNDILSSSSSDTLEIKNEISAIRDTDSIKEADGKGLKARKVSAKSISKTSRTEKLTGN